MALPTITTANFDGWAKIVANQFKEEELNRYILVFRAQYLRKIVGDAAYIDISNESRQKWDDLLNGVEYVDTEGKRKIHNGIVTPIIYFIYFEYVRDNFTATQVGRVKGKSENSDRTGDIENINIARSRFNQGVYLVNQSLGSFLEANEEFNEEVTTSVDNANNTYTLSISNTKYLETGDTVTIFGVKYQAISVTVDTSILIDAGETGLDFTGVGVSWKPFEDVDFCKLEISPI